MRVRDSFFTGTLNANGAAATVGVVIDGIDVGGVAAVVVVVDVGAAVYGVATPRQVPPPEDPHHCLTHPAPFAPFVVEGHRSSFTVANGADRAGPAMLMMMSLSSQAHVNPIIVPSNFVFFVSLNQ